MIRVLKKGVKSSKFIEIFEKKLFEIWIDVIIKTNFQESSKISRGKHG